MIQRSPWTCGMSTQMSKQPCRGMEFQGRKSVGETPSHIFQFMFAKHDAAIPPT